MVQGYDRWCHSDVLCHLPNSLEKAVFRLFSRRAGLALSASLPHFPHCSGGSVVSASDVEAYSVFQPHWRYWYCIAWGLMGILLLVSGVQVSLQLPLHLSLPIFRADDPDMGYPVAYDGQYLVGMGEFAGNN